MIFYRANHTTLWLTIESNEALGILDSDYVEDYNGADGQMTLHHVGSDTDYPLVMAAVPDQTPSIDHDVFKGPIELVGLPSGDYEVRGRVRDLTGNYTILSAFLSPMGSESVQPIVLTIAEGNGYRLVLPVAAVAGVSISATPVDLAAFSATNVGVELIRESVE